MQYTARYRSPMGEILLAADGTGLTGLWFEGAKYYAGGLDPEHEEGSCRFLEMSGNGWTFTLPEKNRISRRPCI